MRFLFVAPSAYLLGGVQDWLYTLAVELRKRNHYVYVAIPNNQFHNGTLYNEYYRDINAIYFRNETSSYEGRIIALSKLLQKYPVDIIVGVNIGDLYEAYKRVFQKIKPTKIVLTLHAIEIEYFRDIGRYSQLLDGVITTNRLSQEIVTSLGLIDKKRIFYAPYGVSSCKTQIDMSDSRILRIAWVGRLENQQKRIDDLFEIVSHLNQNKLCYRLSIAGDGPYRSNLEKGFADEIKHNRVRLVGFLNKSQLQNFYTKNDILLITSRWETGPIVAWEAMLSGLVVVSSTYIGSALEGALINENTSLLFPIGDNKTAAEQISRLANSDLRERIANNAELMARERYSLESSLTSWVKAFETIIRFQPQEKEICLKRYVRSDSGRLDALLGSKIAEIIRVCLGRKGYCHDPGSEWPHSSSSKTISQKLLTYAESLEKHA